jgi:hypothetical protein
VPSASTDADTARLQRFAGRYRFSSISRSKDEEKGERIEGAHLSAFNAMLTDVQKVGKRPRMGTGE